MNVKSRLVFFPSENHWVLNPANQIEWNYEALKWLNENAADKK
jgi:acylaminoacyl-peptidase